MVKLNRSKNYGQNGQKVKESEFLWFTQDGKNFNPATDNEIEDLDVFLGLAPAKKKAAEAPKTEDIIKCKYCDKSYKLGTTPAQKLRAVQFMEGHLQREHPEKLEQIEEPAEKESEDGLRELENSGSGPAE